MRAVVQRVSRASVTIDGQTVGTIEKGVMVLLGVREEDTDAEARYMADKLASLRIFTDEEGKMNLSALDIKGEALVVSNFTLYADCKKGRRPSFVTAARPEKADPLYQSFTRYLSEAGITKVETGVFGADMLVSIDNDGPVTVILDSEEMMPKR